MKQLKFDHKLAQLIIAGEKTATFRIADDKDIQEGDALRIIDKVVPNDPSTWQIIGEARVTMVYEKPIKDIVDADYEGHEKYRNPKDILSIFRGYYGDQISEDVIVKIIRFVFQSFEKPESYFLHVHGAENETARTKFVPARVELYADGGSRGNPGPSAYGYVVYDEEKRELRAGSKYLGITTNNQAEYHALKAGLSWCKDQHITHVDVYMDSLLVVNQMKGVFKVKNRDLWPLYDAIKDLCATFESVRFFHVPRELNKAADAEVNKALDALSS